MNIVADNEPVETSFPAQDDDTSEKRIGYKIIVVVAVALPEVVRGVTDPAIDVVVNSSGIHWWKEYAPLPGHLDRADDEN